MGAVPGAASITVRGRLCTPLGIVIGSEPIRGGLRRRSAPLFAILSLAGAADRLGEVDELLDEFTAETDRASVALVSRCRWV